MRFLRKFMERGTVLFVTHDTGAVLNLCQTAIWLHNGQIVAQGVPKTVTEKYLEKLYESQQGESVKQAPKEPTPNSKSKASPRDFRLDLINQTDHRNTIELFSFDLTEHVLARGDLLLMLWASSMTSGIRYLG